MSMVLERRKQCPNCLRFFKKPERMTLRKWEAQELCSLTCLGDSRRKKAGGWRTQTKECEGCQQVFRPTAEMRKRDWEQNRTCSSYCAIAVATGRRVVPMVPEEQVEPGQRLMFLRRCVRAAGGKLPWTRQMLAADTGISEGTIMKIEEGRTVMVGDWQEKVCAVLKVPTWLLTVPVRRWVQVVRESGLSATHAVVVKGGGE